MLDCPSLPRTYPKSVLLAATSALLLAIAAPALDAQSNGSQRSYDPAVFDAARSSYLAQCDAGAFLTDGSQPCLWAWLESGNHPSWVSQAIDIYLADGCWSGYCDPWWAFSTGYRVPALISIPVRYPNRISQQDRTQILDAFAGNLLHMWGVNPNYQIHQQVGLYLYARFFAPSTSVVYDFVPEYPEVWPNFNYNGRSYVRGGSYPLLQFTVDWLMWRMEYLAKKSYRDRFESELDSNTYAWSYNNALMLLHDATDDPELKRRAKMTLDVLFMDAALDSVIAPNGTQWGGQLNRNYPKSEQSGSTYYYWDVYWPSNRDPLFNWPAVTAAYASQYRLPAHVYDVTELADVDNAYHHIHVERTPVSWDFNAVKSNMVTKNWSLGSGTHYWSLVVRSNEGVPFKIWINEQPTLYQGNDEGPPPFGSYGYQFENAMFIAVANATLHSITGWRTWDEQSIESGWHFFREGDTAVAIRLGAYSAGLQVSSLGADRPPYAYSSYAAFKDAVFATAALTSYTFRNTRGDTISNEYQQSNGVFYPTVNGLRVWGPTIDRLETTRDDGSRIVDWASDVMTVSSGGQSFVYDFNNWTCSDCSATPTPTVSTPSITPSGGSFSGSVNVNLATTTSGATIRYTTDGSNPSASSPVYSSPLTITATTTLKARAFKSGLADSTIASAAFTRSSAPPSGALRFPRRSLMTWGGGVADYYAQFDLLWWASTNTANAQAIKALNPEIQIVVTRDINSGFSDYMDVPDEWKTRSSTGEYCTLYSDEQAFADYTEFAPPLAQFGNQRYNQAVADFYAAAVDLSVFDGFATDGLWSGYYGGAPCNTDIDLDRNGLNDYQEHGRDWIDARILDGAVTALENLRARLGEDKLLMVNSGGPHDWGMAVSNGFLHEHFTGAYGFAWVKERYENWVAGSQQPSIPIVNSDNLNIPNPPIVPTRNDFPLMRYGLTLALITGGYSEFTDQSAGEHYWGKIVDEYALDLGQPTGPPQETPSGAWVRFFDHGMAIINGSDTDSVTVTVGEVQSLSGYDPGSAGTYFRLRGGQDLAVNGASAMNNGQPLDAGHPITLVLRQTDPTIADGVVLMRVPTDAVAPITIDNWNSGTSPGSASPSEDKTTAMPGFTQAWNDGNGCADGADYYTVRCALYEDPNTSAPDATYLSPPFATAPGGSGAKAVYTPGIGVGGFYEVLEWHGTLAGGGGATAVEHAIKHSGGTHTVFVDQTRNAGRWNSLGTFAFAEGSGGNVTLWARGTGGTVMADAIKLEYRGTAGVLPLFADGFESGDRSAWSASAPP